MSTLVEFPTMGAEQLSSLRRFIDGGFRTFSREYGETLERLFDPLREFLIFSERLMTQSPWPLVIGAIALIAWLASRSWKITLGTVLTLLAIGYFGMWIDTMKTVSMIFVCTVVALVLGLPIGIAMSRWDRLQRAINPALDVMQTMPSFVYLIPVVMLLGIGRVAGMIAVVVYAIPPVIRFTNLGIRLVSKDLLEAADAFGASMWQKMFRVQLPLALPTIMAGINQTIMLSLAMVVIASMIGVQGLGQPVLKAIANQYFTMGMFNGLAIVGIAIIFDRVSQTYGKRLQKHLEVVHG
ncbi:MAG: proline/glycine betaine ABC transporter permease [Gammaproteobacteria bacterium]|uniref:ABC transporter permease n=1 Tax=Rhodoferax sp. TaxID=50421 RepID=UPI00181EE55F|nr:proline/glycine betaine ABC transporter permease [Rhodoferax sp.]MBU3900304.1 proline/glycine betaine ABC transporter permease [Gammaproteobacteria bacterium]MBA3057169.1 proline/glycine betaine ABC transporter permease [Rhodoferax sp.]MBU3997910.1 proline/glycine betaine ABC transporter permease [Gammaproteobacteria bacterium]MBU4079358.1 proline/glycine betaine ABC transporter permease [Gammaproteobacteria bacterium]MBU4111764.1 proline/glycine betaine ABC transporter permease [Gammaprote